MPAKTHRLTVILSDDYYNRLLFQKKDKACVSVPDEVRTTLGRYFEEHSINEQKLEEFLVVEKIKPPKKDDDDPWN